MQTPDAHDRVANNPIVEGFNARQQQLTILVGSVMGSVGAVAAGLVPAAQLNEFQLELKNYHKATGDSLAAQLGSDSAKGLSPAAAATKLKVVGPNTVKPPTPMPLWLQFVLITVTSGFAPLLWCVVDTAGVVPHVPRRPPDQPPTSASSPHLPFDPMRAPTHRASSAQV